MLPKVKSKKDDEALVIGHEAGKGKHAGRLGALSCKLRSGKRFKVGTGFSDAQREAPPPVGAVITFSYFELTNDGVPRFPAFERVRPDVSADGFG
jgi:DNA ligase-1